MVREHGGAMQQEGRHATAAAAESMRVETATIGRQTGTYAHAHTHTQKWGAKWKNLHIFKNPKSYVRAEELKVNLVLARLFNTESFGSKREAFVFMVHLGQPISFEFSYYLYVIPFFFCKQKTD